MDRVKVRTIGVDAFFDNFSFAALFSKLHIPGSPHSYIDCSSLKEFNQAIKDMPDAPTPSHLENWGNGEPQQTKAVILSD